MVQVVVNPGRRGKRSPVEDLKKAFLVEISHGADVRSAAHAVGRTLQAYALWRKKDHEFAARVDALRKGAKKQVPPFPEFSATYLHQPMYWHQLQWWDMLEGRPPRDLHPSQTYEPGNPNYVLINTPPEHSKSTCITQNWVTEQLCRNPNIRIAIISKSADMAKKFLFAIKQRLDHPRYNLLAQDIGPVGGYKANAQIWSASQICLGGDDRDSGEKDPTIQALGIGGHIYGARLDIAILDDVADVSNAQDYESHIRWLQQDVLTRLGPTGKLIVVGTRVNTIDIYRELRNPERYPLGASPWSYLASPAVLEGGEDHSKWVTLWPRNCEPWPGDPTPPDSDGLYPRWSGKHLYDRRNMLNARTWSMCYMQADIADDAIFSPEAIRNCTNGMRHCGPMSVDSGIPGARPRGMEGLYIIGGLDPAMTGDTAMCVLGIDRQTGVRWVLDMKIRTSPTPEWIRATVKELTEQYKINEWMVEKNAFQLYLTRDEELNKWLASRGVFLREHFTGRNKGDLQWGVASMAPLFNQKLISLPSTRAEPIRMLVDQLIAWAPDTKGKTDAVMALWFADTRARELVSAVSTKHEAHFMPNKFLSRGGRAQQMVVNLNDYATMQR